ncbi:MAG TPA: Mur ligase family protein [Candidatus Limnocylindrales bacterium]|nr:Mur ligase family protein [Candidatus Limnocylindrales bacterium]
MDIHNLKQANIILSRYIPATRSLTGKDITLQRMKPLMKLLGDPHTKLKIIHIAGTSGKTSTAYYVAAMLQQSGKRVGLTVSPHVMTVTERIQINLQPLSELEFCARLAEFLQLIKGADPQPTYFELLVAFAYWYFAIRGVDYAVIETGLGGLHDATNIASQPDKVCVITDIGYDHTKILGNTLTKITTQKAGIIHRHNEVFCYKQAAVVTRVLQHACTHQQANLHQVLPPDNNELVISLPLFQRRNWHLAQEVYKFIATRDGLPPLSHAQLNETMAVKVPARMETITYKDKTIILDGAHNPQKLAALMASVRYGYPVQQMAVMTGFVHSHKQKIYGNLQQLLPLASQLIITSFIPNQEMHTASADPQVISALCEKLNFHNWEIASEPQAAFRELMARPEPLLLVTGSFYLMHYIRPIILEPHD